MEGIDVMIIPNVHNNVLESLRVKKGDIENEEIFFA